MKRKIKIEVGSLSQALELGLVDRGADQRVAVSWDIVTAEMKLAA